MNLNKPFPIPVVAQGEDGMALAEVEEGLAYMPMPSDMATYQAPSLPDPEVLARQAAVVQVLERTVQALRRDGAMDQTLAIDVLGLVPEARTLLGQVLGEGEVAAQVLPLGQVGAGVQVQESVFAGVWRVITTEGGALLGDHIEVGSVPQVLVDAAREDGLAPKPAHALPPDGAMNAPSLMAEVQAQQRSWHAAKPPHVINMSLLPLSGPDTAYLDAELGSGRVLILSRGYGNCRISNTAVPRTWRVTYFNSTDTVILDTLEICRIPEVACAAAEDLADSAERLAEVLAWVQDH